MSDRNFCLSATLPIENISRGLYALHAARCSFFKDEWIGECIVLGVLLDYHSETIGMITMNIELILILIIFCKYESFARSIKFLPDLLFFLEIF
jgi:hypothetical protein